MTISRKLLLLATLGFGIQFSAFAQFDALQLKNEVTTILNFISTLHLHADNSSDETIRNNSAKIAQWLEINLEDKDWDTAFQNFHIIALANVIQNSVKKDAHISDTIDEIQNIITNKSAEDARQAQEQRKRECTRYKESILSIGGMTALLVAMGYVITQCQTIRLTV